MGIIVAYSVLAVIFLALSSGLFTPKSWHQLSKGNITFLRLGSFFGLLFLIFKIVNKLN